MVSSPALAQDSKSPRKQDDKSSSSEIDELVRQGVTAAKTGKFSESLRLLEQALQVRPNDRQLLYQAGRISQAYAKRLAQAQQREASNDAFLQSAKLCRRLQQAAKTLSD